MFGAIFSLFLNNFYLALRLSGRGGSFPRPLTRAEEDEALRQIETGQGTEKTLARERLILHNLRLVAHVIKKYYTNATDQDDLLSIGTIGLVKAIDSYKSDKNVKLPTYACKCIQNEIFMHFRGQKKRAADLSLSDQLDNESEGPALTVIDVVQTDDYTQEHLELAETYKLVATLIDRLLDERSKEIIKMRFGIGGKIPMTQKEVASKLGISRSYVSRLETRSLGILESALKELD